MAKKPTVTVTNVTNPLNVSVVTSHGNAVSVAIIKSETNSLSVGDYIEVNMGYDGSNTKVFSGYVKIVEQEWPDGLYTATAHDVLVRAVDYFIASKNPNNPLTYSKIKAEKLVENILAEAGLTNYVGDNTNFTYAYTVEAEINLIGAYEFCRQIADMLAWHIYAKPNGQIRFLDRKPYYVSATDVAEKTITHPSILSIAENTTDKDLRNRVVVYGAEGVFAEAKAASPYLPAGYYKTAVLSSWIVDNQSMAQLAANYNLNTWNRLRYGLNMTIEGDPSLLARDVVHVTDTQYLGINSNWYVYSAEHIYSTGGYTTNLELRR